MKPGPTKPCPSKPWPSRWAAPCFQRFAWILWAFVVAVSGLPVRAESNDQLPRPAGEPVDFSRDVQPLFQRYCHECHGPQRQRSSFRLDRRSDAMRGGDLGPAIVTGSSQESPLIQYVAGQEEGLLMPPEGDVLSPDQIGILRRWIDDGASWPDALSGDDAQPTERWWALQPLAGPTPPELPGVDRDWIRSPLDAFVVARLHESGLQPTEHANRRTLLRRLKFDLHGLPPAPEEYRNFLEDPDPLAYERLVERFLASPQYGERWARHWLDVVHYADSHGQDQDRPRPHAWPYRDYLIRSFNADRPYARFVENQVAGDHLSPDDPSAIIATGFLAAGPWDESSLRDIREDSIDRLIGQYLDRDDIVTNTMSSFTAMTVGCARCHDHKFDPISQADYYALQAVFAGTDKAERAYDSDPDVAARRRQLSQQLEQAKTWRQEHHDALLSAELQEEAAAFEDSRAQVISSWQTLEPISWEAQQGSTLKALLDRSILAVGDRPEKDSYLVRGTTDLAEITGLRLEVLTDETLPQKGPGRQENGNFHLSELRVKAHPLGQPELARPIKIHTAVADFNQADWDISRAIDGNSGTAWGIHPAVGENHEGVFLFEEPLALSPEHVLVVELDQLHGGGHLIGRFRLSVTEATRPQLPTLLPVPDSMARLLEIPAGQRNDRQRAELAGWVLELRLEREWSELPPQSKVYSGTSQFVADGSFRPATEPRPIHILTRGEVTQPRELARPGALPAVTELSGLFPDEPGQAEGERRAALARWLSHPDNPLTWRVMVNRIWQHHFGRGIVDTPNDFGRMGGSPTHPELLDFLARRFLESGGSVKQLQREIVTSSTYRQSSQHHELGEAIDKENRLLWRMNRRRMDAESVRDSYHAVSDSLDLRMFGSPVMHFVMSPGVHVTPNADYASFDVESPASWRRSIYRFILRTKPDPWMEALDCPDASQSAPVRNESLGPLQSLALWNNPLVLYQAERLAELASDGQENREVGDQVAWICQRLFYRVPTEPELSSWVAYAERHGLANLCRVLLNSSEFLFVD